MSSNGLSGIKSVNIFQHIKDGIIILNNHGRVSYFNPSAAQCLGLNEYDGEQSSIAGLFQWDNCANDDFCQFLLDCIYEKNSLHTGTVPYVLPDGQQKLLEVRASFWSDPEQPDSSGILLVFHDNTQQEQQKKQRQNAVIVFNTIIVLMCLWVTLVKALDSFNIEYTPFVMSYVQLGIGLVAGFFLHMKTKGSFSGSFGLSKKGLRESLMTNGILTVIAIGLMALVKLLIVKSGSGFFPEDQPFWYFRITSIGMLIYPVSVFLQEFIARSLLYDSIERILDGKHIALKATLAASMMFTALHVHRSFAYMVGAFLLISLTTPLYIKHRNIWGLCMLHYLVTLAAIFLGFI